MSLLEEVRFEARFKRLRYLLLARTGTVEEEPSLYTVRDEDGLCSSTVSSRPGTSPRSPR
jgi:hypothetical protein